MYLTTLPGIMKIFGLGSVIIVMILSSDSFFKTEKLRGNLKNKSWVDVKCDLADKVKKEGKIKFKPGDCPVSAKSILLEDYLVFLAFVVIILSVGSLLLFIYAKASKITQMMYMVDSGYHAVAGIMMIIAGITTLLAVIEVKKFAKLMGELNSAKNKLVKEADEAKTSGTVNVGNHTTSGIGNATLDDLKKAGLEQFDHYGVDYRYTEKLASAGFAILNGALYVATAAIVGKQFLAGRQGQPGQPQGQQQQSMQQMQPQQQYQPSAQLSQANLSQHVPSMR